VRIRIFQYAGIWVARIPQSDGKNANIYGFPTMQAAHVFATTVIEQARKLQANITEMLGPNGFLKTWKPAEGVRVQ
jgi:hypothetical protein